MSTTVTFHLDLRQPFRPTPDSGKDLTDLRRDIRLMRLTHNAVLIPYAKRLTEAEVRTEEVQVAKAGVDAQTHIIDERRKELKDKGLEDWLIREHKKDIREAEGKLAHAKYLLKNAEDKLAEAKRLTEADQLKYKQLMTHAGLLLNFDTVVANFCTNDVEMVNVYRRILTDIQSGKLRSQDELIGRLPTFVRTLYRDMTDANVPTVYIMDDKVMRQLVAGSSEQVAVPT